jgi:hypothetical protein
MDGAAEEALQAVLGIPMDPDPDPTPDPTYPDPIYFKDVKKLFFFQFFL